jgi:CBS domain-containing protein
MVLKIRDRMSRDVVVIGPEDTVRDAVRAMSSNDIGCVVVERDGKPVGIFTERDLVKKIVAPGTDANFTKIKDAMSKRLVTLDSKTSIQDAAEILERKAIRRLPVLEGGRLVGIVTMTDLLRELRKIEKSDAERLKKTIKSLHLTKIKLQSRIITLEEKLSRKK